MSASDSATDPPLSPAAAAAALRWLQQAGADALVSNAPGNWLDPPFAMPEQAAPPPPRPAQQVDERPPSPFDAAPPDRQQAYPASAPQAAQPRTRIDIAARTLDDLRAEVETLPFAVRRDNSPTVFADGRADSGIMVIGEAPGAQEEREGRPFVGPAGQLLDKMLAAIGLDRTSERSGVYITNLSLWRPGANRVPNVQEAAELLPLLHRHIALVRPRVILAVGGASAKALLDTPSGIMRLRGRWHDIEAEGHKVPVLPTFHPAYLLREPAQKRFAWADLLAFRSRIETSSNTV